MIAMLAAAVAFHAFVPTPEEGALQAISSVGKRPPVVRRVNRAGAYATVLTAGGMMEGSPVTAPILLQHFRWGWQALEIVNFRCRLTSHRLGAATQAALMRGMPVPEDIRACDGDLADAGPAADVQAVRGRMRGPLVPYVIVSHDWALGQWYGAGGGQSLYRREHGHWRQVAGGGGAMELAVARAHGVSYADACKLRLYDAKCR